MKDDWRSPCGCAGSRPLPPRPPVRPEGGRRPAPPGPCDWGGGYLMQRILARGSLHSCRGCYSLCFSCLPEDACGPLCLQDVSVCAPPQWEEAPCRDRRGLPLLVTVPLMAQVQDSAGRRFCLPTALKEELLLRFLCAPGECWRGQPVVQAAVRLAGRRCSFSCDRCEAPLEVFIEGYLVAPCSLRDAEQPCCPRPLPWYPEPICCNPCRD